MVSLTALVGTRVRWSLVEDGRDRQRAASDFPDDMLDLGVMHPNSVSILPLILPVVRSSVFECVAIDTLHSSYPGSGSVGGHRLFFDIVLRNKSERPRASVVHEAPPSGGSCLPGREVYS